MSDRRIRCATGLTDDELNHAGSNGTLHPDDLDELRRFGAFLRATGAVTDEAEKRRIYLEHYPEHRPDAGPEIPNPR